MTNKSGTDEARLKDLQKQIKEFDQELFPEDPMAYTPCRNEMIWMAEQLRQSWKEAEGLREEVRRLQKSQIAICDHIQVNKITCPRCEALRSEGSGDE